MTRQEGFTLIELVISIAILAGMTIVSVQKFRLIQQDDSLNAGAMRISAALRQAQGNAQSGQNTDYSLARAFAVHFEKASANSMGSAVVFADLNTDNGTGKWDGDTPNGQGAKDLKIGTTISPDANGKKEVSITALTIGDTTPASADIAFLAPGASGRIDGGTDHDTVTITLTSAKNTHTKKVVYNRVSGRIDILN